MSSAKIAVVTGGAGFIGSHMVDLLLQEGFVVRVIDNLSGGRESNLSHHSANSQMSLLVTDIRKLEPLHAVFKGATFIFHFAGIGDIVPSIENPIEYMEVNIQGTVRMLEAGRANSVQKFVYAASSSCYGLASVPTTESHPLSPQYPYALSKLLGEQAAFHWHRVYGLPVNSVRIFNAYGTRSRTSGVYGAVFGVFLRQKLAGRPFTVVGDGTQRRDFVYVSDVAKAFYAAAITEIVGRHWNLGAGNPQSINRLTELLVGDVEYIPKRPGEPECTWADITAISNDLQWFPLVDFEEGIGRMMLDIERWRDAPLWDPESIKQATTTWFKYLAKDQS
ncbi:MAG: NAD-dependent epimerase/dehydratase family protein [Acidimicrobiaceae bacterium]|nr:NAD-dependent epimerase/dehydratase family protein [Acidimicrobiaceae bacterium]